MSKPYGKVLEAKISGRFLQKATQRISTRSLITFVKEAVFFLYLYCGYVPVRDFVLACLGRSRAVVLYYHRIGEGDVLTKTAEDFRGELAYMKGRYEALGFRQLCEKIGADKPMRKRSVVITFDDGYRDNFTRAVPILKGLNMTATFFVSTGFIGTSREFPHDLRNASEDRTIHFPKLTWEDLREMEAEGFEIGSHTINHANLGRVDQATVKCEIEGSLKMLDRELGDRPRAFSFPWGKPEDISTVAIEAAKGAGYYAATSAYGGANRRGTSLFAIRRVDVGNGELSRLAVRARIAGFDPDFYRLKFKKWDV